jgi:hypothetical protein
VIHPVTCDDGRFFVPADEGPKRVRARLGARDG